MHSSSISSSEISVGVAGWESEASRNGREVSVQASEPFSIFEWKAPNPHADCFGQRVAFTANNLFA